MSSQMDIGSARAVVIGAGPAGLACAAELGRRGVRSVVLERANAIGASWRGRYDRLRLNSSRPFSRLPRGRFPRGTEMFPSRDEMVSYLEGYAGRHGLDVRPGTALERIDQDGRGWRLHTSAGELAAEQVIVAGGYAHTPFIPRWTGREEFPGALLHAAEYRNPEPFQAADVLVVGPGCSGMEIAYDLAEGGAARVRLAVRTPPNMIVRAPAGPLFARAAMKLPPLRADALLNFVRRREIGDLSEYGLPVPDEGVFSRLRRLEVAPAIVDHETIQAIRDRRIEIVAGVESLDERGVELADGARLEPDALIAATGYRTGLEPLVGHLDLLDERGAPRVRGGAEAAPGLRFVGYVPRPGQLGYIAGEARRVAKAIAGARSAPASIRARRARPARAGRRAAA